MGALFSRATRGSLLLRVVVGASAVVLTIVVVAVVTLRVPDRSPGAEWLRVGPVSAIREKGVVYLADAHAYVVADPHAAPIALHAASPQMGERVRYCPSSGWFEDPAHGSKFDRLGRYALGPAPRGLDRLAVRVLDGIVWIDPQDVTPGPPRGETTSRPSGPFCVGNG